MQQSVAIDCGTTMSGVVKTILNAEALLEVTVYWDEKQRADPPKMVGKLPDGQRCKTGPPDACRGHWPDTSPDSARYLGDFRRPYGL